MEHYPITVSTAEGSLSLEVKDYMFEESDRCKFYVYLGGKLQASFRPDSQGILHPCTNDAGLDRELLGAIADEIEKVNF